MASGSISQVCNYFLKTIQLYLILFILIDFSTSFIVIIFVLPILLSLYSAVIHSGANAGVMSAFVSAAKSAPPGLIYQGLSQPGYASQETGTGLFIFQSTEGPHSA